jgi:cell division septation protein DedD
MKSKIYLSGLVLVILFSLSACKAQESNYANVYAAAKSKSTVEEERKEPAPVEKTKPTTPAPNTFQRERVTPVDGAGIKQYSVVIGSFVNRTNAESLRDRMKAKGYDTFLAKNDKNMYRVIAATSDTKTDAIAIRDRIKERYDSEFSDSWLLEQIN